MIFLCRAADYYNVTADYLLGRSESKRGFEGAFGIQSDLASDFSVQSIPADESSGGRTIIIRFGDEA